MSDRHIPRGRTLIALVLSGAIALGGSLSGCGQKGPLFLPQQKKTRVPATPSNPEPDAPDTSSSTSDSIPPA